MARSGITLDDGTEEVSMELGKLAILGLLDGCTRSAPGGSLKVAPR
jgi:hypothetical protein